MIDEGLIFSLNQSTGGTCSNSNQIPKFVTLLVFFAMNLLGEQFGSKGILGDRTA